MNVKETIYEVTIEAGECAELILLVHAVVAFGLGKAMLDWPYWAEDVFFWLYLIFLVLDIFALIGKALSGDWSRFGMLFFADGLLLIISAFILGFIAMGAPDKFAQSHPIPKGMNYYLPASEDESPLIEENDTTTWLQIREVTHGSYMYDFYSNSLPAGVVYLKCYEAGKKVPLSEDGSRCAISNITAVPHSEIKEFDIIAQRKKFYIYEGDIDQYYAVRIEAWHRDSLTNKEYKLTEKIYRVEGWMR